jgi:hypothetical protein
MILFEGRMALPRDLRHRKKLLAHTEYSAARPTRIHQRLANSVIAASVALPFCAESQIRRSESEL